MKGRRWVYDGKTPHLAVCVGTGGSRTFYVYRRIEGRPVRIRLGDFPAMTVEQARRLAVKTNFDIQNGIDPRKEKRAIRGEATLREAFNHHLDTYLKDHTRSWVESERMFDKYVGKLADRRLSDIHPTELSALHVRIGKNHGKYQANRVVSLIRATFNYAIRHGAKCTNPAGKVAKFKERSRDRFLAPDELKRFLLALNDEPEQIWKDFFLMLLLTGARRGNVQSMRWDDVSIDRGLWRIPAEESKSDEPLLVILTPPAVRILQRRASEANGSEYVFPAFKGDGHITEPRAAWRRLLKRANIDNFRIHDLRRTVGSWAAAAGVSLPIIGKLLGHKSQAATGVYARLDVEPVRAAMDSVTVAFGFLPVIENEAEGSTDDAEETDN
jgi:integrase